MTVTTTYLDGAPEPFAETIRYMLHSHWDATNTDGATPAIISEQGRDGAAAGAPLTANDMRLKHDQPGIIIRGGDTKTIKTGAGKSFVEQATAVYVDVFGTVKFRQLAELEIDRIIMEHAPDAGTRLPKSDGSDSAAVYFLQSHVAWQRVSDQRVPGTVPQSTGDIEVVWERTRS